MNQFEQYHKQYGHYIEITVDKMFKDKEAILHRYGIENEDLLQVGLIGFWEAINTYDESKSNIKTHIINRVKWKIFNYLRYIKPNNEVSIEKEELVFSDNRDYDYKSNKETLNLIRRELTNRQYYILEELMDGLTQGEIADKLGCCRAVVNKEYGRIKMKMNKHRELLIK